MDIGKRQVVIFAIGLALGIAGAWLAFDAYRSPEAAAPAAGAVEAPAAGGAAATASRSAAVPAAGAPCPTQTATALGDVKDGQFQLQADVSGKTEKEAAAFIVVGKEAAASGRARDAEVAFMMSCRVAEQDQGVNPLVVADAKYQLARHYANLALHGGPTNRTELMRRAERLYTDSLEVYRASHGADHEKTRFAAEGLASLRPPAAESRPPSSAKAPAPAGAGKDTIAGTAAAPKRAPATPEPASTPASTPASAPASAAARVPPVPPAPATTPRGAPATASTGNRAPSAPPATARAQPQPAAPNAPAAVASAPTRAAPPAAAAGAAKPAAARSAPAQATMGAPAQAQGSADALARPPAARTAQGSATAAAGDPPRPSFDCAKARSRPEKIICSDAELARQDRELGRLHAQARRAATDSAAFKRRSDEEWRRREATCGDRECLLRWYARRRGQLLDELEDSGAPAAGRL